MRCYWTIALLLLGVGITAQGYEIKVNAPHFKGDTIYLGVHYGKAQYLRDTAYRTPNNDFVIQGDEERNPGVYLIVFPPKNDVVQVLLNRNDQVFEVEVVDKGGKIDIEKVKGSEDNQVFQKYIHFLAAQGPLANQLNEQIKKAEAAGNDTESLKQELDDINSLVRKEQQSIINKYPNSLTSLLIQGTLSPELPEFEGSEEEQNVQKYYYSRKHYFDLIDLKDERLVHTPFFYQKVTQYFEKIVPQVPDTIHAELDLFFAKLEGNEEAYKYYLVHFLNFYAKYEYVGFDAVYVHLVENYYAQGKTPWVEEGQLKKIIRTATTLKPLLIGQKAPNIQLATRDNQKIDLYSIDAPVTILYIWDPDCGHCKKSRPDMEKAYEKYKDQGVKFFAVCAKLKTKKEPEGDQKCWTYIDQYPGMSEWINVVDPYHLSRYKILYDVKTTPQLYVLDKDKIIKSKKIGAEQLPGVIDFLLDEQKVEGTN